MTPKKKIELWALRHEDGTYWSTRKGKSFWNSSGAAKNAYLNQKYSSKSSFEKDNDGFSAVKLGEYILHENN